MRDLLSFLSGLHEEAGRPSLTEIGRAVALAPSTLSAFFTGARLINRGNLELLVEYLDGDVERAERLRRRAAIAWQAPARTARAVEPELDDAGARIDIALFTAPTNHINRPERFLGRDAHVREVDAVLDAGGAVLVHGLAGSGKTALAATVADRRVAAGLGPYLWLRPGTADVETTLDALVRLIAGAAGRERLRDTEGDGRVKAIQEMVLAAGVSLLVVDDVWQPATLHALLRAVPAGVGTLVTSRMKFGVAHQVEVGELDPADARELLTLHAGAGSQQGEAELCRDLGYHPYAVEIAGRHLKQYGATPAELREQLAGTPHELAAPAGYAAAERTSIKRLLDRTCAALDSEDARLALLAFGALYSGSATVPLLATYLGFGRPRTWAAVNHLVDGGFARRLPGTSAYKLHDLTFSYARMLGGECAVKAVAEFARVRARDHAVLQADMDNLLGAAAAARESDPDAFWSIVETLAVDGYVDDHTLGLVRLLELAVERVRDEPGRCHTLLTRLGNARYNEGEPAAARRAYAAAQAAPTPMRTVVSRPPARTTTGTHVGSST